MAENIQGDAAVVAEQTCGICLEDSKNPLNLPCGHSFCDGCLGEWRSRYGVEEEMRKKCPICRASIPPSKEMVSTLLTYRARKQTLEDEKNTSSEYYHFICRRLKQSEERVGADWDGMTVLEDNEKPAVTMPDYIAVALTKGGPKPVLKWINANRTEDRANAISNAETMSIPALTMASIFGHLTLMILLLQLGADTDLRVGYGHTAIGIVFDSNKCGTGDSDKMVRLLLSWGASFFPEEGCSRECCVSVARQYGAHQLANLIESELGGRRCEIVSLQSRADLNGKTCVVDEYLSNNQYTVTLEDKSKEVLVLSSDNLKRRDRTPQDCGYYIEFKNGRTIRHDFDSSEDCQAFVAALYRDEAQPAVTEEAEARAEQAAAELLAELGLDNAPTSIPRSDGQVKKSKKQKGGKKKKK